MAGQLRLELAQYRELATFAQFGTSDLDAATRDQLTRGQLATEILKQPQYQPLSLGNEVAILFAVNAGLLSDIPLERCADFEEQFLRHFSSTQGDIGEAIAESGELTPELETRLTEVINDFKAGFNA